MYDLFAAHVLVGLKQDSIVFEIIPIVTIESQFNFIFGSSSANLNHFIAAQKTRAYILNISFRAADGFYRNVNPTK